VDSGEYLLACSRYIERVAEIDDRGHAFLSERSCSAT
jgi:hypothetical protein